MAPLGYRDFALFFGGVIGSNTGRWIELTGAVWAAFELTGSPVLVGLLGVARAVPSIVLSPLAGVTMDRVDPRRVLLTAQALTLASAAMIGTLVVAVRIEAWHLYAQVTLQAAIGAFETTARQTLFPHLVARRHLAEAVTLNSTAARIAALAGPAIGGLAIARLGLAAPFLAHATLNLALIGAVLAMRTRPALVTPGGASIARDMAEGVRYIVRAPLLSGLLRLEVVFSLFQVNPVIIAILGREVFGLGPEGVGAMLSAPALGALAAVGALIIAGQRARGGRVVVASTLAYAGAGVALALGGDERVALAALVLVGFFDSLATVTRHGIMQLAAPPAMRGRVMANMGTVTRGLGPLAQTQSGALTGLFGPIAAVTIAAGSVAVAAALTALRSPAVWEFDRDRTSASG